MKRFFYPQLAFTNIRKHSKSYIPYILSSLFTVSMFYILYSLANDTKIEAMPGGDSLISMLNFGVIVVIVFAVIFIFYTNSFLIKQRKKEIGLYNILGMEKKHIMTMLLFENIYVIFLCIGLGMALGILFSKLLFMVLYNLISYSVGPAFYISIPSILFTMMVFIPIFLLTLLFNIFQIHISNPITLLQGSNVGEKEPKTQWLLAIIGILCLGVAYYIAQTIDNPLSAFIWFFGAVILVIIGTYILFLAGSIALLKILKRNKKFYYQTNHFTVVSGMIYRMKQNAVGLANICILSTCIVVMLSTTVSLYFGIDDMLDKRFTTDIISTTNNATKEQQTEIKQIYKDLTKQYNVYPTDFVSYSYEFIDVSKKGSTFTANELGNNYIFMIPIDDYNAMENTHITLKDNEVLWVNGPDDKITGSNVRINDTSFTIKDFVTADKVSLESQFLINTHVMVTATENIICTLYQESMPAGTLPEDTLRYTFTCNLKLKTANEKNFINALDTQLREHNVSSVQHRDMMEESFIAMYGGFLFIGIFLGIEFLIATALIIYYKQISEGYDDKNRYAIMQKVGMSNQEIKKSIHFQVLSVFFLPLLVAIIHYSFAFKMITQLLELFQLTNTNLFLLCSLITIVIFILFYSIVYFFTSKAYYKIIK